jgi:hypothetical protein
LADIHDEKRGVEAAFLHLEQIGLLIGIERIERVGREIERDVDVRVERQGCRVQDSGIDWTRFSGDGVWIVRTRRKNEAK